MTKLWIPLLTLLIQTVQSVWFADTAYETLKAAATITVNLSSDINCETPNLGPRSDREYTAFDIFISSNTIRDSAYLPARLCHLQKDITIRPSAALSIAIPADIGRADLYFFTLHRHDLPSRGKPIPDIDPELTWSYAFRVEDTTEDYSGFELTHNITWDAAKLPCSQISCVRRCLLVTPWKVNECLRGCEDVDVQLSEEQFSLVKRYGTVKPTPTFSSFRCERTVGQVDSPTTTTMGETGVGETGTGDLGTGGAGLTTTTTTPVSTRMHPAEYHPTARMRRSGEDADAEGEVVRERERGTGRPGGWAMVAWGVLILGATMGVIGFGRI